MQDSNQCKGCTASVRVDAETMYEKMKKALLSQDNCVSIEEYERRVEICTSCPSLAYETTCKHCGCFVHMRAIGKSTACPYPGSPKW